MGDDYLWLWADRCGQATVLRVRGELDVVTADQFIATAASELRQATGPVSIDLSFLDYLDCAGARALEAVVRALPPWRLTEVRGIQRPVARLLELIGMDLPVPTAAAFFSAVACGTPRAGPRRLRPARFPRGCALPRRTRPPLAARAACSCWRASQAPCRSRRPAG